MPELLLVRHGETAMNQERRWQGQHDAPLTACGRAEARALAERVAAAHPVALYSSDLPRASETAAAMAALTGLELTLDVRWREVDVGEWLGLTPDEVELRHPDGYARWLAGGTGWEQGESYLEMAERGMQAARDVVSAHAGATQPIACVTHGGVIRAIVMRVLGMPPEARRLLATGRTATITSIDAGSPTWRLRSFNDSGHLPV
jgi:broad specificity phosphatase PhoE